jgi:hypothetical protein
MKKLLNSRVIIALFLCSVFVCGAQLAFTDTVSAASYKKFDSGKIKSEGITLKYTSYIKGKNNIYVKLSYNNQVIGKIYMVKGKTNITYTAKFTGQKTQKTSTKHNGKNIKTFYKKFKKDLTSSS